MNANKKTSGQRSDALIKAVIYIVLIVLAVTIIVPVAWVFMASVKQNSEFYGNPFTLLRASTCKTLWMPGPRPAWASTS